MAEKPKTFLGWLGRQIGAVKGAIKKDVTPPKVLYRKTTVHEAAVPDRPEEKLRRTVTDEVVRDERKLPPSGPPQ
jgi:hypothetical protein